MIKTPVSYDDSENVFYTYPQVEDANGSFIFECKDKQVAQDIVKRINMHNELVAAVEMLIPSFIHESYTEDDEKKIVYLYELLERCK